MYSSSLLRFTALAFGVVIAVMPIRGSAQGGPAFQSMPGAPAPAPRPGGMRDVFAATLAAVVQSTGVSAASAVSQGLNGAIANWLDRKAQRKQQRQYTTSTYGSPAPAGYPQYPGDPAQSSYPQMGAPGAGDTGNAYPGTGYPSTPADNGYPNTNTPGGYPAGGASNDGYPSTGYPDTGNSTGDYPGGGYPSTNYPGSDYPGGAAPGNGSPGGLPPLYAGFAYEIHALGAGGYSQPVDPATHAFRTGDRFKVLYRPSLPGQVDVYNINPAGQNTHIDTLSVAAGQLAELGPYEFTDLRGNETLILSLSACSTPALMTATRNIVKVPEGGSGDYPVGNGGFELDPCGSPTTRSLRARTKTRDIRKVTVEGGTNFGLDPLSAREMSSGDVAARQITITLQHQ
jgi:hypothetical protein